MGDRIIDTQPDLSFGDPDEAETTGPAANWSLESVSKNFPKPDGKSFIDLLNQLPQNNQVLELGPGGGTTARQIIERFPNVNLSVLSPTQPPNFNGRWYKGGIIGIPENLELSKTEKFDLIFAHNVWYLLYDKVKALQNTARLLKPNGWFLANMIALKPERSSRFKKEMHERGYLFKLDVTEDKPYVINPADWCSLALKNTRALNGNFISTLTPEDFRIY